MKRAAIALSVLHAMLAGLCVWAVRGQTSETQRHMMLLIAFAIVTGWCFWGYWRERNRNHVLAEALRVIAKEGLISLEWTEDGGCEIHRPSSPEAEQARAAYFEEDPRS